MAYQTCRALWIPRLMGLGSSYYDNSTLAVDASGEKAAFIMRVPATGTLKKVGFRTGSVTQNQTLRVSLQDVDSATGAPDGVADQWRNVAILDTDDNVPLETGLLTSDGTDGGTLRSVVRGELLAVVFEHNPFNAGDVFRLTQLNASGDSCGAAYGAQYTTSWSKSGNPPVLALIYDEAGGESCHHFPDVFPCTQAYNYLGFNQGSANPKRGLKFKLPFPAKLSGAMLRMRPLGDASVKLYDSDGQTELLTQTLGAATTETSYVRWHHVKFNGEASLLKNTYYYLLVEPSSSSNVDLLYMEAPAGKAWYLEQMDGGQDFHYAERSTGAPSATLTRRPLISLELVALEDGAAAGGAGGPIIISY